jgi:dihydroorotase
MGTTGLESSFAVLHTELVLPGVIGLALLLERLTAGARLLELEVPAIAVGRSANLALFDLEARWTIGEAGYESRSSNCCFAGREVRGRNLLTLADGAVAYRERAFALSAA